MKRKEEITLSKILLVDGNSILNRAFYGIRPLTTGKGLPVNALYGMLNILSRALDTVKPDHAAVAFDVSKHTFRHDRYPEYKAGRKPMPEELAIQLPYAKKLVSALGFGLLEKQGHEADDLLGTYSRMAEEAGMEAWVFTGDRDSLQLISDKTKVLLATNKDNLVFDTEEFRKNYGIPPSQFVFVKALMGDSSDNIPGVPGIGEKTALKLIAQFGSLDALYADIENAEAGASAKAKLIAGKQSAYDSLWLATIDRYAPVTVTLEELAYDGMDRGAMYRLLTEFEFVNHLKRFGLTATDGESENGQKNASDNDNGAINTAENAEYGAKTESAPLKAEDAPPIKISGIYDVYGKSKMGHPLAIHICESTLFLSDGERTFQADYPSLTELCEDIASNGRRLIVCDGKALTNTLCRVLRRNVSPDICDDVMLAGYILNPSSHSYDIRSLCTVYLGEEPGHAPEKFPIRLMKLAVILRQRLEESGQSGIYRDIEMPLSAVLSEMERAGFKVDVSGLNAFGDNLSALASEYAERIYMLAGREFNINSPKQLGEVLFEELKLPHGKKTQTGFSTNAEVLEKLRYDYPIVEDILEYRSVTKLKSTYADGLCKAADENGRVHTSFNQTITVTGRLSSTEPNLQNIPVRTELGRELRRFFVPENADYVLIDADYSQIELRLLAHIAGDEGMISGFKSGEDIHRITASQVFGVPISAVTPELRKRAKAVNFGIVYGIGEFSLAQDIGVSRKEAGEYIRSYFAKYPKISEYLTDIVDKAKRDGYVDTVFGRRRYIPELTSPKAMLRAFGERVAMNSPIQGASADIIKLAMIAVKRRLEEEKLDARLILQVHDELIVEARRDCAERAASILREEMESVASLSVPLTVELSVGDSWYACK